MTSWVGSQKKKILYDKEFGVPQKGCFPKQTLGKKIIFYFNSYCEPKRPLINWSSNISEEGEWLEGDFIVMLLGRW